MHDVYYLYRTRTTRGQLSYCQVEVSRAKNHEKPLKIVPVYFNCHIIYDRKMRSETHDTLFTRHYPILTNDILWIIVFIIDAVSKQLRNETIHRSIHVNPCSRFARISSLKNNSRNTVRRNKHRSPLAHVQTAWRPLHSCFLSND